MADFQIDGDQVQKGQSLALGNFDGVHLGHQAVLAQAREKGALGVVSFDPHPRRFFNPDHDRFELMNARVLERVLRRYDARSVYQIRFDKALSQMGAQEFLDALNFHFAPCAITTGHDFRFARDRQGDVGLLRNWGAQNNVPIFVTEPVELEGVRVSSTLIRQALSRGRPEKAAQLLGRPHIINQFVAKGDQRGRDLGFPTANLYPQSVMLPKFGIYASRIVIHDGAHSGEYLGASSLGVRPSFGINQPNFETYILDFDADIYGVELSVELISYLRGEVKFDDLDALINQMNADVIECRKILETSSHA